MCLILFAYNCHPNYRLILAANRDEYFQRPTEKAHFWESYPWVLAGRDLEMLGTWMGITSSGRFAALTNYRDPSLQLTNAKSRGKLVSDFLCMNECPTNYLQDVAKYRELYNPFNLIVGDLSCLVYYSKQTSELKELKPGIYGLSNHLLDTPWPKVLKAKQALANHIENNKTLIKAQALFEILADDEKALDHELPNTGINYVLEKQLSSIFIQGMDYGTRSSAVILIDRNNHVTFTEKSFSPGQKNSIEVRHEFRII
ncbi:NRDE family protein [Desulfosporosinus lacus]|uniref:Uncharacterized conserved protein, contains NRDE domain n=1 Tax=Desulfosporosinus lacus DSM 15449 TaxID=1121420 RepID=A0A1M5YAA0_9FIRM|nr:NRDE family protein [Desulfosporosinus lacus]SHI08764.1 Uncharacterized conserved protein, contains NRDE domain [Desulfosporosinus lacus DSM 15449]